MGFFSRIPSTTPADVAARMADRSVVVIDVRQPAEWRRGHIKGAHNLPLPQLAARLHGIPVDKCVVTVCATGHRSAAAARAFLRAGYRVENLAGGVHAWSRAGLPLTR